MIISSDFPGGNIVIHKVLNDTIWLEPDISHTEGSWFYWNFKIENIEDKTLYFQFTKENMLTSFGPAYSLNNDHSWRWLGEQSYQNDGFSFSFTNSDTLAHFCTAMPYTSKHLYAFLDHLKDNPIVRLDTLCVSPQQRAVETLTISPQNPNRISKHKVVITARHHASEMMANYVMEGIILYLLEDKSLAYLREYVEFLFLPFMDKDGVENGEQGKNRIPRDHNRDYDGSPIHTTTAALQLLFPAWSDGKARIALDLHCPWIKGEGNEYVYIVGNIDPLKEAHQMIFSTLLHIHSDGDIRYDHQYFLPFGEKWNTKQNFSQGRSFSQWANLQEGITMAAILEFPYANVLGVPVTKDGARRFGRAIAYAIQEYLQDLD